MDAKLYFEDIRTIFCSQSEVITVGKMMSSEAIHYKGKVFAFFSTKEKMVFKLGKDFNPESDTLPLEVFSPFKSKKPLSGWFQLDYSYKQSWYNLAEKALQLIQS
ncbi:hypothetical protein [uncultured Algibacter sp.]|uniref:hypothetical protein n=1 Tax=uncultured Algibacter sp. TaxID=298659 RepID=UPI002636A792|nr:hypothetical protein [uncultured Algibacter sp.]